MTRAGGEDEHPVPRLNDRIPGGNDDFVPPEDAQEQGLLGELKIFQGLADNGGFDQGLGFQDLGGLAPDGDAGDDLAPAHIGEEGVDGRNAGG